MSRPVLLDLFGCEGGAAAGYHDAGFEVWSVDLDAARARHNVHTWHVGDWADGLSRALATGRLAAVHASPPCQAYSVTKHTHAVYYPELLEPVRAALIATGLPYVIENVVGAPMRSPLTLCGTHFGLGTTDTDGSRLHLRRHRLFESNVALTAPAKVEVLVEVLGELVPMPVEVPDATNWHGRGSAGCLCSLVVAQGSKCAGVYGGGSSDRTHAEKIRHGGYVPATAVRSRLLGGVPWMTQRGQAESLPPSYTRHLGSQLLAP